MPNNFYVTNHVKSSSTIMQTTPAHISFSRCLGNCTDTALWHEAHTELNLEENCPNGTEKSIELLVQESLVLVHRVVSKHCHPEDLSESLFRAQDARAAKFRSILLRVSFDLTLFLKSQLNYMRCSASL